MDIPEIAWILMVILIQWFLYTIFGSVNVLCAIQSAMKLNCSSNVSIVSMYYNGAVRFGKF